MPDKKPSRILSIDPGMQYLGIAVLEGEEIVWYGVKTFPEARTAREIYVKVEGYLSSILDKFGSTVLAIEEPFYPQSLSSENLRKLTERIKTWAKWRGLRVRSYYHPRLKHSSAEIRRRNNRLLRCLSKSIRT